MAAEPNAKSWRLGVTAKLAIAFCALLVCCAGLGVFALNRLDDIEASARDLGGHWLQTTRALGDVAYLGQRFRVIEAAVLLAPPEGKAAERKTLAAIRADVEAAFARQAQNLRSAEERRGLDDAQSAWNAYLALDDRFLAAGPEDAARLYRTQMRDSIHTFQDAVKAAIQRNVAGADAAARASETSGEAGKRDLVAGFAILALICVAIGWRLQGSIVRPVRALTSAMTGLAEGALDVDVPGLNRADEIGDMARASAVFRDAARQRRADLEAEADAQRQAAHQARDAEQATRERADRTQREAMQALGAALGALAKGDMLRRLDADFPAEFGDLRDDYERARETLGSALSAVVAASTALAQEHRALDRSAEELSSRTERQAANLEQSAAALQEITTAVKTSSESASEARAAVHSTKTQAERGADVAAEAIAAMDGLAQSAKEIREITSLIDEIAFQTSLLALNAGVEAARAGEAGKGFAVVAMEVRALAGRSADMAQRISDLISASNRQVELGVAKVGATGEALGRIAQEVGRLNGIVEDIARGAADQARSLVEVNAAIREMDQTTQNNAALAEESHATTRRFAEEIAALDARLRPFRLDPAMAEREAA